MGSFFQVSIIEILFKLLQASHYKSNCFAGKSLTIEGNPQTYCREVPELKCFVFTRHIEFPSLRRECEQQIGQLIAPPRKANSIPSDVRYK